MGRVLAARRVPTHLARARAPGRAGRRSTASCPTSRARAIPLYIAGAKLVGLQSVGPLLEGVGLNVTVWSYLGSMHCSVLCCPDTLPDPHAVTAGMARALDELVARA